MHQRRQQFFIARFPQSFISRKPAERQGSVLRRAKSEMKGGLPLLRRYLGFNWVLKNYFPMKKRIVKKFPLDHLRFIGFYWRFKKTVGRTKFPLCGICPAIIFFPILIFLCAHPQSTGASAEWRFCSAWSNAPFAPALHL